MKRVKVESGKANRIKIKGYYDILRKHYPQTPPHGLRYLATGQAERTDRLPGYPNHRLG